MVSMCDFRPDNVRVLDNIATDEEECSLDVLLQQELQQVGCHLSWAVVKGESPDIGIWASYYIIRGTVLAGPITHIGVDLRRAAGWFSMVQTDVGCT